MKKTVCFALAAILAGSALPLQAVDFGVGVESLTSLEDIAADVPVGFTEIVRLSSYFSFKAGRIFKMNASGYGDFGYSTFADPVFALNGNLDRLEMTFTPLPEDVRARLAIKAGRLRASDPASLIGMSRIDGLQADFSKNQLDLGLDCGYLGLLSGREMRILMSGPDINDYDENYYFAPPRLYSALRARFVELFAGQDLQILVASQADLRKVLQPDVTDVVHTEYAEILLEGPIALGFDYKLGGVYELIHRMSEENKVNHSGSAKLKLGWSDPAIIASKANLTVDWAAGSLGGLVPFAPVCSSTAGDSFDIVMSSLLRYKLAYACTPARGLTAGASATGFMRAGSDEPEDPQYVAGTANVWLGEEFGANVVWSPFSDLELEAKGSCFLPAWGYTFMNDTRAHWDASLIISISL